MNVVIAGSSRGIGLELAKMFASRPEHKVIALSRNVNSLETLNKQANFTSLTFDLGSSGQTTPLLKVTEEFFGGKVDILINNGANFIKKPFSRFNTKDFDQLFGVNVKGVFFLIQSLLPCFRQPSHIVNISSMGGYQGSAKFPELSLYAASKGAMAIMGECLAEELKPLQISINTLAIGAVNTQMFQKAFPGEEARVSAASMAEYIYHFALTGQKVYNGKTLPVSLNTP